MTRVLHIGTGNLYGGVETLLTTLAREAGGAPGLEQHFGLCFEGRLSDDLRDTGKSVHLLGRVRLRDPRSVYRARRTLRRVIREERLELVVCHSAWAMVVFGKVARAAGLPLVFWLNDTANSRHWIYRLAKRISPDFVVCNSHYTAGTLQHLYPGVPHRVIYYPVAPPSPDAADSGSPSLRSRAGLRDELTTPDESTVILQVSRMEAWKGHELHLQALGELVDVPGWILWVVGGAQRAEEKRYRERLEHLAAELGISERVRFTGQRSDVQRLYPAADIHCQPNLGPEPFGLVFVEALYAGLPCVTTAMGGAQEIVDASCGALVAPGDVKALARTLRDLITDPGERARLGAAGPARALSLCDPEVQMQKLAGTLSSLVR